MRKNIEYIGFGRVAGKDVFYYNKLDVDCDLGKLISDEILREPSQVENKSVFQLFSSMKRFFNIYADELGISWMEYYHEENDLRSRENDILLVSLKKKVNNRRCNYPIGLPKAYLYNWSALVEFLIYIQSSQASTSSITDNVVALSPYSTGIFIHEVLGHISEMEDVESLITIKDGKIYDIPIAMMNYEKDDSGVPGIKVDISRSKIKKVTGNHFWGVSEQREVFSLIRQRNLEFLPDTKFGSVTNPILPIFMAGINCVKKSLNMIVEVSGDLKKVNVPLTDILSVRAINRDMTEFIEICHKQKCPHYFGLRVPWSEIVFAKSIGEYLDNKNNN